MLRQISQGHPIGFHASVWSTRPPNRPPFWGLSSQRCLYNTCLGQRTGPFCGLRGQFSRPTSPTPLRLYHFEVCDDAPVIRRSRSYLSDCFMPARAPPRGPVAHFTALAGRISGLLGRLFDIRHGPQRKREKDERVRYGCYSSPNPGGFWFSLLWIARQRWPVR